MPCLSLYLPSNSVKGRVRGGLFLPFLVYSECHIDLARPYLTSMSAHHNRSKPRLKVRSIQILKVTYTPLRNLTFLYDRIQSYTVMGLLQTCLCRCEWPDCFFFFFSFKFIFDPGCLWFVGLVLETRVYGVIVVLFSRLAIVLVVRWALWDGV